MIHNPSPPQWALLFGVFHTLAGLALLALPADDATALLRSFPRSAWAGRVLSALAWTGAAWATFLMPLDFLRPVQQPHVLVLVTLTLTLLTWWWMPDLLACRGVAGLLMLFPCPLFLSVRSHPSAWRLALVILGYIAAVKGMVLMFSPHYLRRACHLLAEHSMLRKAGGAVLLVLGAFFIILALTILKTNHTP